jgi:hypothetical protein
MHDNDRLGRRNVGLVLGAGTHQPMHSLSASGAGGGGGSGGGGGGVEAVAAAKSSRRPRAYAAPAASGGSARRRCPHLIGPHPHAHNIWLSRLGLARGF